MKKDMYLADEVAEMIKSGKKLILAGDEKILTGLPEGDWIGGTIPYFMSCDGGVCTQDKIFVNELPEYVADAKIKCYDPDEIRNVYNDGPENGFSIIIIPAFSSVFMNFVLKVHTFENFATKPLAGWMSGTLLSENNNQIPKVFDGSKTGIYENKAVVIHVELPPDKRADIDIINIFKPGSGDIIEFYEDSLTVKDVMINGQKTNFADYLLDNKIDTRLPIVTDMYGATINTSFKEIDKNKKNVSFFAPAFQGMKYTMADTVGDYVESFKKQMPSSDTNNIFFSCNCILNYLYAELEGKKTEGVVGPITFGEVAFQFLNQTLVYLTIEDVN